MKLKHLIIGAVMTAFSLLALAAPEAAPAGSAAATSAPTAAPKAAKAKSTKKGKKKKGKTRGLKSKKGKECESDNGCHGGQRQ